MRDLLIVSAIASSTLLGLALVAAPAIGWWLGWAERRDLAALPNPIGLLAALPASRRCLVCTAQHCSGCAEPARTTATHHGHISRHGQDEIPPSILAPALAMDVVRRARELARQLGPGVPARVRMAMTPALAAGGVA